MLKRSLSRRRRGCVLKEVIFKRERFSSGGSFSRGRNPGREKRYPPPKATTKKRKRKMRTGA